MPWDVRVSEDARRDLKQLDQTVSRRIIAFLEGRIAASENPRQLGIAMQGRLGGYWRYRVGDYRLICDIQDETITVLVLHIGHRSEVYI